MRILIVHNAYQQRGGEDGVVALEIGLLRGAGHEVALERVTNDSISGAAAKAAAFLRTPYDRRRRDWMVGLVKERRPDIVHIHNFFPLLTPAIHEGATEAGAAVVQTLHNYRTVCASATFLRDGAVCEKCLTGKRYWGVVHRCYRGSLPGSLALARMQFRADRHGTWHRHVHRYIALTDFARQKFVAGGFPVDRIAVKPNFVVQSMIAAPQNRSGALFVGRLSPEKGVDTLLKAWASLPDVPLTIVGDGPNAFNWRATAPKNVTFLGELSSAEVAEQMRRSAFLVVPSLWYEGFPMVLLEAFAAALPVVASRIGSLAELVRPGENGALFDPGDAESLRATVREICQSTTVLKTLGMGAKHLSETLYTPQQNLAQLEAIYQQAAEAAATPMQITT